MSGLAALAVDPAYVSDYLNNMDRLVLISGTNGKTTTTALAAAATRVEGTPVWTNATGSNLERGIAAEVVRCAAWHGGLGAASVTTGIFEVDEMALAALVPPVTPTVVVLLNLFRDQLDRFGEVDSRGRRTCSPRPRRFVGQALRSRGPRPDLSPRFGLRLPDQY